MSPYQSSIVVGYMRCVEYKVVTVKVLCDLGKGSRIKHEKYIPAEHSHHYLSSIGMVL